MIPIDKSLIAAALSHLTASKLEQDGQIKKANISHLQAFGPSLRTNGLEGTLLIYLSDSASAGDLKAILPTIKNLLLDPDSGLMIEDERNSLKTSENSLDYIESLADDNMAINRFQRQIERAVTALKIASRTYEITTKNPEDESE